MKEYYDLVKNIRKGDPHSLELLFRRLYPRLCAFANKFLNDMDSAEDIVQDVFFKICKNTHELDENKSIQSYMFTSVRNSCLNLLTHKKTENKYTQLMASVYLESTAGAGPHEALIAEDIEKDFHIALAQLPAQCRKIFELSRFEGLKYHEIATRLDISIKTVETQMSRALLKIRYQLKSHLATILIILLTPAIPHNSRSSHPIESHTHTLHQYSPPPEISIRKPVS